MNKIVMVLPIFLVASLLFQTRVQAQETARNSEMQYTLARKTNNNSELGAENFQRTNSTASRAEATTQVAAYEKTPSENDRSQRFKYSAAESQKADQKYKNGYFKRPKRNPKNKR